MGLISGIGNVGRPVTSFTSAEPRRYDYQSVTVMPRKDEEKKSNHTFLKLLGTAAIVAGAMILYKNRGKVVDKVKELIERFKPQTAVPQADAAEATQKAVKTSLVERIENMAGLNKPVKSAEESMGVFVKNDVKKALSQKSVITSETIDAGLALKESGKSAKESAAVFKEFGKTETEVALKEAEKKAKPKTPRKPRKKTATTKTTATKTTRKPRGKMPVRAKAVKSQGQELAKVKITEINEPRIVSSQVIDEMVGLNRTPKSAQESMGVFVKRDVENIFAKKTPMQPSAIDARLGLGEAPKSAKESARVFSEYGLTDTEKAYKPAKKAKVHAGNYEPSKGKVIRQHSELPQGQAVQAGSRANTRKIRHNKKQIIAQTLEKERQYVYPESVYKYETEASAKQKASDVRSAWNEYDYRRLYG